MKSVLYLAAFACIATAAQAQEFYVGATVSPSVHGTTTITDGGQRITADSNNATPIKAMAGVDINTNFAIEAGYKSFGTIDTNFGDSAGTALNSKGYAFYLAAKGMLPLSDNWTLTGKLGVAQRYFGATFTTTAGQVTSDATKQGALYSSIGVDYKLTKHLTLTAELENFGEARVKNLYMSTLGLSTGVELRF